MPLKYTLWVVQFQFWSFIDFYLINKKFLKLSFIDTSQLHQDIKFRTGSKTIAELLANHHHLFPQWLLLVCTARRQSKNISRMFTGFRKLSLDDLRKSHVITF